MTSLAEQLSQLANPAPIFDDPEDIQDDTAAKLIKEGSVDDDGLSLENTALRRKNAKLLSESDARYAGKKVSRKSLDDFGMTEGQQVDKSSERSDVNMDGDDDNVEDDDDDEEMDAEEGSEAEEESEEEIDDDSLATFQQKMKSQVPEKKFEFEDDGDYSKYADSEEEGSSEGDSEEGSGEDDDADEDEEDEDEDEESSEDEEEGGIKSFSHTDANEERQKGEATRAQLSLWDSLLKSRIELQKLVSIVNQLPQPDCWHQFVAQGGDEYQQKVKAAQGSMKKVLDELVQLQTAVLLQNPETKHVVDPGKQKTPNKSEKQIDDDEEIPSDSETEEPEKEVEEENRALKRKVKMADYPEFLAKRHKAFQEYRNNTIQKWHDKTRVASGKLAKGFSAFEQSALKQIEQILSDRERLIQRTQLKRTVYKVLGKVEEKKEENVEDPTMETSIPARDHLKDYDEEIFDDGDFYHQLLRELIERKTSDISDPVALSRQWLEIQKLRSKVKRKVDTRASKGRKIRYDVHPKLVNFVAPCDNSKWTDEARNDLYSSLFGQRQPNGTAS